MLNAKSFLTVDFGAGTLKVAEFEVNEEGGLRLRQYAMKPLGAEGSQESAREALIQKTLTELLAEKGMRAKDVNVCAPGFHVFSKFVKLPPVDASKVTQIIQYEAQQNVPFPLAEVVWDYQILGTAASGEMEVLLVAIKSDIVEGLFRVSESAGLRLQLADVSPAALCNAFRYNYSDLEDCTMLLDIGAKTSNLLFFEKGKVYARSINLGANSITQDFANESKLPFNDADQKKISEGFVSLGGAYEEPENAHQAAISKIARQFMTRLHIQVNQTMQFYRGQQGGSMPQRLFLAGGASLMPYTAQFFAEKLNVPVEYFNPFRNVQIDPSINLEDLARVAHSLGEVVGLGLRNLAHCPVELNLMPESTLSWVQFNQKKPYFIATVFSLVLVVFAGGFIFKQLANINAKELETLDMPIRKLQAREAQYKRALGDMGNSFKEANQYSDWVQDRYYWADVLTELHRILIKVEAQKASDLRHSTGVWIEKFITDPEVTDILVTSSGATPPAPTPARVAEPALPTPPPNVAAQAPTQPAADPVSTAGMSAADIEIKKRMQDHENAVKAEEARTRGAGGGAAPPPTVNQAPTPIGVTPVAPVSVLVTPGLATPGAAVVHRSKPLPAEITTVYLHCRGVDLNEISGTASANRDIAGALVDALKESQYFDKDQTQLAGDYNPDSGTFTFGVKLKLKRPLKMM